MRPFCKHHYLSSMNAGSESSNSSRVSRKNVAAAAWSAGERGGTIFGAAGVAGEPTAYVLAEAAGEKVEVDAAAAFRGKATKESTTAAGSTSYLRIPLRTGVCTQNSR